MTLSLVIIFLLFGLLAGLMIGCVGIGGVILVPLLSYGAGIDIRVALAAAMFAYLISGVVGTWVYSREKSMRWDLTGWMWLGAMPAALLGALMLQVFPGWILELCLGAITAASGIDAFTRSRADSKPIAPPASETDSQDDPTLGTANASIIGGVTGFLSSLTGTGGPLVLIPILLWLNVPVLTTVGLGVAIQLPIAALATAGNVYTGNLDVALGAILGVGILFGTWGGAKLAHILPRQTLRKIISLLLIIVGSIILAKLLISALG